MAGTGGIQVLRFQGRRTLDIHLVRHIEGQRRHATTRASATIDGGSACVDLGGVGLAAARAAVERHWPTGRGRKPHQALDMVFAGAPPYLIPVRDVDGKVVTKEDQDGVPRPMYQPNPERWSPERELEWANSVAATLPELVGDESVVASVSLHRDELSAHVQAVVVPVRDGKLGWCRVRDAAAARLAPQVKAARKKAVGRGEEAPELSTRTRYGVLQDALYWGVSREYGLSRGQVGSEATHVEIDRAAAAEARVGHVLYETEQARVAAKEAAAQADASRQARTKYHDQAVENVTAAREARQDRAKAERERDTARTERDQAVGDLEAFNARGTWVRRVHAERELRQREQADAERRAELDHEERVLNEREEQAATATADVERREADLATAKTRLEEGRAAVAAERREADETRQTADAVFRTAARRHEKAEELELEVSDDLEELARRKEKLKEEEEQGRRQREEQDEELRRRSEELGQVKDEEKTWRQKVAGLKAQVEEWGRQLAEAREKLKQVLERVGNLQRREEAVLGLEERKEGLDAKECELESRETSAGEKERELEEREQRVKSREADANEKERNIGSREAKVSEREDAVVGLEEREDAAKTLAANGQQALGKARKMLAESNERVRQADALYAGSEGHLIVEGVAKWMEKELGDEVRDEFLRRIAPEDPELTQRASTPMVVESSLAPRPGYSRPQSASRTAPATQRDNDPSGHF